MALTWLLLVCVVILLYLGYKFLYAPFQVFRNHGIKGPRPLPLVGNFLTRYKMGYIKYHNHLTEEFGPVVGYYQGAMPMLKVTDVDMLKQILVKEFDSFTDRPLIPDVTREPSAPQGLLGTKGEEWKTARSTLSPTFSAAKMKAMLPLIEKSANTLVEVVDQFADSNESVDVSKLFGRYTMETILATAFGRRVEVQKGESDEIVTAAREVFRSGDEKSSMSFIIIMPLMWTLPWIEYPFRWMVKYSPVIKYIEKMWSVSKQLVQERRNTPSSQKYKDLLQLMMEATYKPDGSEGSPQQKLTDDQIVAHSTTFLLAGYETTSTALSYVSYLLALHPTVQEKLQQEIDHYFQNNPDGPLYDAVQELEYLDKVVHESLRLYSPAGGLLRYCQKTVEINGVTIPEGVSVDVPIHILHRDPTYWRDPEVFDPERFSSEEKAKRPPLSYIPFGYGPRNCIGMRLALIEAKLALIQLLRKYTLVRAPDTEVPLEISFGITVTPKNGVLLKIIKRE